MVQSEKIIMVESLKKSYKNFKILKGIHFTIAKGQIFALLGSNGAGKTTTVNLLSTLIKPDSGKAAICGYDTVLQSNKVREHISLTGQYAAVDELLTGRENLRMIGAFLKNGIIDRFRSMPIADLSVLTGQKTSLCPQSLKPYARFC